MPKDAIHAGLAWSSELRAEPKICFGARPSEYRGEHLVDDAGQLDPSFEARVYGGFGFSTGTHGLDLSTARSDLGRDNFVCWQLGHPDAFNDTGVFAILDFSGAPLVSPDDYALTRAAFTDAGDSTGLHYNIFCAGNVALPDGRWLFIGGHDKSGNNGIGKMNIFDPVTETWADRGIPPVKQAFLLDPEGELPYPSPLDEDNTDPPHPSDMKYQRWYPSAAVMPDGQILILSGSDQDTSLGPPGTQFAPCSSRTANAACSKVRHAVPEVYDPITDRTIALENAQKLLAMYPQMFPVQTGPGVDDWKIAVVGVVDEAFLDGGELPLVIAGQYDPFTYNGETYLIDVQAARADPDRDVAGTDHWELVATAATAHNSGASAQLWTLDDRGRARSQRVVLFGGGCGRVPLVDGVPAFECPQDRVEMIDFQAPTPTWLPQEPLVKPTSQNNAVALPDGNVLVVGGALGRGPWDNSFALQLFDPLKGTIHTLLETAVPRHDHSTAALLPDGRVMIMGGNTTDLPNDPAKVDLGIAVAQIYEPSYLFRGVRPTITAAPHQIRYGERFELELDNAARIREIVLIRPGPITHNWDWGNRYVKLWSHMQTSRRLTVQAPAVPGLAVEGYYMLFAVSKAGVPSMAQLVHLTRAD